MNAGGDGKGKGGGQGNRGGGNRGGKGGGNRGGSRNRKGKKGKGGRPDVPAGGSGADLGTQVLRYSGLHSVGLVINNILTFIGALVVAFVLGPEDFGRFGLLLFLAGLLNLIFNAGSKQGTMKQVFGGDDDDEDDDDDATGGVSESPERSLGTGLVLTGIIALVGTAIVVYFAEPISSGLLQGEGNRELIIWAGLAGGFGAIYRLASLSIWMERRPIAYIAAETAKPILILAILVPLVATGAGLEGAIAGTAIGTAVASVLAVFILGRSVDICFTAAEAKTIMRRGSVRIPIVASMFTVGYADVFIVSRYVSESDLGVYTLASKAGFIVAFLPAGYRKALRPLRRTTGFAAVEAEYGAGVARGTQLGYFLLMLAGVLLGITLLAQVLIKAAPDSYAQAGGLIPLLAAGLVAPTTFRMINKSAKFGNKSRVFLLGAVSAALLFIVFSLVLVPKIGMEGAPISMLAAFAVPATYILYRSQTGQSPMRLPKRSSLIAFSTAAALAGLYHSVTPPGVILEVALAAGLWLFWALLIFLTGAIPSYHRGPLVQMGLALIGRAPDRFDPELAVAGLPKARRRPLRMAIIGRRSFEQIAEKTGVEDPTSVSADLVGTLREMAADRGINAEASSIDDEIGSYLFSSETVANRDAISKRLITESGADSGDLRKLEVVVEDLRKVPRPVWRGKPVKRG